MKKNNFLQKNKKIITWLLFGLIIVIATFLRFYKLASLPVGLNPDEAFYGNEAVKLLGSISLKSIYSSMISGGIFLKFISLSVKIFGNTIFALRAVPAFFGVLSVLMVCLLSKKWFGGRTALIAGLLMASSPWMVAISRSVSPASMQPFLVALCLYLATLAVIKNKMVYYVMLGLSLAIGLYSYFTFYFILPIFLIGFIALILKNKGWVRKATTNLIVALTIFLVTVIPLFVVFSKHPNIYIDKIISSSAFKKDKSSKIISVLADGSAKAILAFNFKGDDNYFYNLAGLPMLNTFVGVVFILGLMIAIVRIRRVKYAILLSLFVFGLLPVILMPNTSSISAKLAICSVAVFIFAGIGVNYLLAKWYSIFPVNAIVRNLGLAMILMLMLLSLWQGYKQYFVAWAQDPKTYFASSQDSTEIARYLINNKSAQQGATIFLSINSQDLPTVTYLANRKVSYELADLEKIKSLPVSSGRKIFIVQSDDAGNEIVDILKAKFPSGQLNEKLSDYTDQKLFYSYVVN